MYSPTSPIGIIRELRSLMLVTAIGCCAVVLTGTPGATAAPPRDSQSAGAATARDAASGRAALRAYRRYVSGLVLDIPAWRRADDAFVASISTGCPNVLAAMPVLTSGSVNQSAVTAFGQELVTDLEVVARASDRVPLARMANALTRLRWSSQRTSAKVKRYLASYRALFGLSPSDVCADAQALAASNAQTTPPGTLKWLAIYSRDEKPAAATGLAFVRLLNRFRTPADLPEIAAINRLSARAQSAITALLAAEAPKLLSALGISG